MEPAVSAIVSAALCDRLAGEDRQGLPAGTPIAQVVPICRETLLKESIARPSTPEELAEQQHATQRKYGEASTYSREWRAKK